MTNERAETSPRKSRPSAASGVRERPGEPWPGETSTPIAPPENRPKLDTMS